MKPSCEGCVYRPTEKIDYKYGDNCRECSRFYYDRYSPTFTAIERHTIHLGETSTEIMIAINQTGPGYYVGDQTDPDSLEWVLTIREASEMLSCLVKREG